MTRWILAVGIVLAIMAPWASPARAGLFREPCRYVTSSQAEDDLRTTRMMADQKNIDGALVLLAEYEKKYPHEAEVFVQIAGLRRDRKEQDAEILALRKAVALFDCHGPFTAEIEKQANAHRARLASLSPFDKTFQNARADLVQSLSKCADRCMRHEHYKFAERQLRFARLMESWDKSLDNQMMECLWNRVDARLPGGNLFDGKRVDDWKVAAGAWAVRDYCLVSDTVRDGNTRLELKASISQEAGIVLVVSVAERKMLPVKHEDGTIGPDKALGPIGKPGIMLLNKAAGRERYELKFGAQSEFKMTVDGDDNKNEKVVEVFSLPEPPNPTKPVEIRVYSRDGVLTVEQQGQTVFSYRSKRSQSIRELSLTASDDSCYFHHVHLQK